MEINTFNIKYYYSMANLNLTEFPLSSIYYGTSISALFVLLGFKMYAQQFVLTSPFPLSQTVIQGLPTLVFYVKSGVLLLCSVV